MARPPVSGLPPDLTGVSVLLVDDETPVLAAMRDMLEACGAGVVVATSAYDAALGLGQFRPDVVVTDLRMPVLDGYWLIRQLRTLHPDVRALAVTGYGDHLTRAEAMQAGFAEQMEKPLDIYVFCATVGRLARRRRMATRDSRCPTCQPPRTKALRAQGEGWAMRCEDCRTTFHLAG